jgi:hypothetical protein
MKNFRWWCSNCETVLHLETRENKEDYDRGVGLYPETPICPMCAVEMYDTDDLTARDPSLCDADAWVSFDRWRKKIEAGVL